MQQAAGLTFHVPDGLFAEAESLSFAGQYAPGQLNAGADTFLFEAPLEYNLLLSNTGGALLLTGTLAGQGTCSCARCLEPATYSFNAPVEEYILLPGGRDVPTEEVDEEEYPVLPESHELELEPILQAALVLEFPLTPLCREDCAGLCATCGANLNEGPCGCEPAEDEFDANPFAVLKNYTFESGEEPGEE